MLLSHSEVFSNPIDLDHRCIACVSAVIDVSRPYVIDVSWWFFPGEIIPEIDRNSRHDTVGTGDNTVSYP